MNGILFAVDIVMLVVGYSNKVTLLNSQLSLRNPACLKTFRKKEPNAFKHAIKGPAKSLLQLTEGVR